MMTSYVARLSARNLKPSPMKTVTRGEAKSSDMCGRYVLDTRTTAYMQGEIGDEEMEGRRTSSMSHRTTCSTVSCFKTSLTTPPSPPPMTSTFFGLGWLARGRCAIISW